MMYEIFVGENLVAKVAGADFAYDVFNKACEIADLIGDYAYLYCADTCIASTEDTDDYDFDEADLECGFNPYEGCYDFDC